MKEMKVPMAGRIVGAVFGLVFFGIGLTVIGFMWFGDDGFGSPPVFFKIFASLIACAFVAMGGTLAAASIKGGSVQVPDVALDQAAREGKALQVSPGSYLCPSCGATLQKADVSPMGDVKCTFCGSWFNVHGKR